MPLLVPVFTRLVEARTAPVASLMNVARADLGFVSGTLTGSEPARVSSWLIDTRAWALMKLTFDGTVFSRKPTGGTNHGRSISVNLTSSIPASHGPASTVSSG